MHRSPETSSLKRINAIIGALFGFLGAVFITFLWVQYKLGDGDGWQALGVGIVGVVIVPLLTLAGLIAGLLEHRRVFGPLLRGFAAILAAICVYFGIAILAQDNENERLYGGVKYRMLAVTERRDIASAALTPLGGSAYWICSVSAVKPDDRPDRHDESCWIPDKLPAWQPGLKFRLTVCWFREGHFSDEDFLVSAPEYENNKEGFFVILFGRDNEVCLYTAYGERNSYDLKPASGKACSIMAK
ncbi:hypothetical protein IDA53_001031 [Salmonella enterica]|nr:hypothetical protein [Salmonella enterica]